MSAIAAAARSDETLQAAQSEGPQSGAESASPNSVMGKPISLHGGIA